MACASHLALVNGSFKSVAFRLGILVSGFRICMPTARRRLSSQSKPPPFPVIPDCPEPTCTCAATPAMPDGLKIDRQGQLNGAISSYAEHVLICTGKDDWPSRIEEENGGDNLAADLRELFGRGGMYSDVSHGRS